MTLIDPNDPPARREEKLIRICDALMRRVEQAANDNASSYEQFQRAVMLEERVRERTRELEATLALLHDSNAQLATANEAAQAARAHLSNALEALREGFGLFGADDRLIMFNQRFCRQMPDVWEALREGITFAEYVDLVGRSRYLDLRAEGGADNWISQRNRLHADRHAMFNMRLADGSYFQVSEHRTPDGGAAIIQTDVTEMIQAERAERARMLDDQARLVRATLDHIDRGVVMFDGELRMAGWNRQLGALLVPPANLVRVGVRFSALLDAISSDVDFLGGASPDAVRDWVENRKSRPPLNFELVRGELILSVLARVMPGGGFVISFSDITAERAAVDALMTSKSVLEQRVEERTKELQSALGMAERANATKTRFVAAVGHDLMQPLSAAKLYLASSEAMAASPDAALLARRATSALESVEAIIGDLLEISKLDSGRPMMTLAPLSLRETLDGLRDDFLPLAAEKGLTFRFRAPDIWIETDAGYFRRILQNLIANAVRYTTSGGVLIGVRKRGDAARVEVWDTGPGIAEEHREDIFEEFNRIGATASAAEGLGLGLSIVERAARTLGHPIYLWSREGRGSCFAIEAPMLRGAAAATGGKKDGAPLALIVMRDAERRRAIVAQLETWGLLTLDADDGLSAMELLRETGVRADAILTDAANAADPVAGLRALSHVRDETPVALISRGAGDVGAVGEWTVLREPLNASAVLEFIAEAAPLTSGVFPGAR